MLKSPIPGTFFAWIANCADGRSTKNFLIPVLRLVATLDRKIARILLEGPPRNFDPPLTQLTEYDMGRNVGVLALRDVRELKLEMLVGGRLHINENEMLTFHLAQNPYVASHRISSALT